MNSQRDMAAVKAGHYLRSWHGPCIDQGVINRKTKLMFYKFLKDNSGTTPIEFGVIALVVSVGIITAATSLGTENASLFESVAESVTTVMSGSSTP